MRKQICTTALVSLVLLTAVPAPVGADETITVHVWLDGSATAPGEAEPFAVRCDVTIPANSTAADALHQAEADGCADFDFLDFGIGEFVDCVNDACTESYDPSGLWLLSRWWAFYHNCTLLPCTPSNLGISAVTVQDGDTVLMAYELSTWAGNLPNPATVFWVNNQDYPFES